jgi:hypothetical protein
MLETLGLIIGILAGIVAITGAIASIYRRIKKKKERRPFPLSPDLHNQTPPEPNFVGREKEFSTITQWYRDPKMHIGVLVGWSGFGKSVIARRWFDLLKENKIHPDGIFVWVLSQSLS